MLARHGVCRPVVAVPLVQRGVLKSALVMGRVGQVSVGRRIGRNNLDRSQVDDRAAAGGVGLAAVREQVRPAECRVPVDAVLRRTDNCSVREVEVDPVLPASSIDGVLENIRRPARDGCRTADGRRKAIRRRTKDAPDQPPPNHEDRYAQKATEPDGEGPAERASCSSEDCHNDALLNVAPTYAAPPSARVRPGRRLPPGQAARGRKTTAASPRSNHHRRW